MNEAFELIKTNDYILVFSLLAIAGIIVMFIIAFIQEREIKFWPPSIGARPEKSTDISNEFIESNNNSCFFTLREDYYKKYYELVSHAKESVTMIGDGFACHDINNNECAIGLIKAIKTALKNNVPVRRFQYNTTLSLAWLKLLCDLKEDHGDLFQIYMHKEFDPIILPYIICLVDKQQDHASVNVMFTHSSDTSLEEKSAGSAFIFEQGDHIDELMRKMLLSVDDFYDSNYNMSCADLLNLYSSLKVSRTDKIKKYFHTNKMIDVDPTSARQIAKNINILDVDLVTEIALRELSNRNELYFAYGSNVDRDRIRKRCPSAQAVGIGHIRGYKLILNMFGNLAEGKNGGIANIVKLAGNVVYGVLYKLDKNELDSLNRLEESMNYRVVKENITTELYGDISATVYIGEGDSENIYKPTRQYKKFIEDGMVQHKFPENYQKEIINLLNI